MHDVRGLLLDGLTTSQQEAVCSSRRRALIIAGAGGGKTEVMARRIAWWTAAVGVPKDEIVAFTFTEKAAQEMKFRIRSAIQRVTPDGEDATLGGMYVGTIHGFCLQRLRELDPDTYHNFEVIDDATRIGLVERGFRRPLELERYQEASHLDRHEAVTEFLQAYDLLNEFATCEVATGAVPAPYDTRAEGDWCAEAALLADVGGSARARAFGNAAARYYCAGRFVYPSRSMALSPSGSQLIAPDGVNGQHTSTRRRLSCPCHSSN